MSAATSVRIIITRPHIGGIDIMAHRRGSALFVAPLLALSLFLVGCPKRPATMAASAPAPGVATPPPAPASGTPPPASAPTTVTPPAPTAPPAAAAPATPQVGAPTPAPAVLPRPSEFAANANLKDVYFEFDRYDIRPEAARILDANATWLKGNPRNLLLIEGHCDERGTAEYNLALGERRAKSTLNYLVGQGVAASRITVISYGKERPVCTEKTEACWAMNRRAHHLVKAQ
jgi:peptidoglycan-associated lipoprotein